ncbi:MAG: hypothetical protein U5N55_05845 [Cypionkella sp.]|nr:hypothetical protein [Cypionkella sp.]
MASHPTPPTQEARPLPNPEVALPKMSMPPAETDWVQSYYRSAGAILEYGSGGSTAFAACHTSAAIVSIESDAKWAADLIDTLTRAGVMRDGIDIRHANIGKTREWGMPASHNDWRRYWAYPMGFWQNPTRMDPDLVLIDGRFRLGCFLATILNTRRPVTVLWDDYVGRENSLYSMAEDWFAIAETRGRMVRFDVTPRSYDNAQFSAMLQGFFSSR